jgi:hypothetical protein
MSEEPDIWQRLREPFRVEEIKWRVGNIAYSGKTTSLLAYIDARCAFDRFDEVIGPAKWRNSYQQGPIGGVLCRIEVLVDGEWVGKEDGADGTHIEATKGGYSDAFKRAAVVWGAGRYLYSLPTGWHNIKKGHSPAGAVNVYRKADQRKGTPEVKGYCVRPQLPQWALHSKDKKLKTQKRNKTEDDANKERQARHDPSWDAASQGWRMFCDEDLGSTIEYVNGFLEWIDRPRASSMSNKTRDAVRGWMRGDAGRAKLQAYQEWKNGGEHGRTT